MWNPSATKSNKLLKLKMSETGPGLNCSSDDPNPTQPLSSVPLYISCIDVVWTHLVWKSGAFIEKTLRWCLLRPSATCSHCSMNSHSKAGSCCTMEMLSQVIESWKMITCLWSARVQARIPPKFMKWYTVFHSRVEIQSIHKADPRTSPSLQEAGMGLVHGWRVLRC